MARRKGRYAWQLVAAVAFAGTAALAVALTRSQPVALPQPQAQCSTRELDASLGPWPTGRPLSNDYTLLFTNVSRRTCVLDGYPDVWAYTGAHPIGSQAAQDRLVRPGMVTLAPGATAHAVLHYTGTGRFPATACHQVTAAELRIYPSSDTVPWHIPACSRRGVSFLSVQPFQPLGGSRRAAHY
jgi:hypothetical protein